MAEYSLSDFFGVFMDQDEVKVYKIPTWNEPNRQLYLNRAWSTNDLLHDQNTIRSENFALS